MGGNTMSALERRLGAWRSWTLAMTVQELCDAVLDGCHVDVVTPLTAPPVACIDLRARGAQARLEGHPLVVDVTSCGPEACPAVRMGAHLALADVGEGLCVASVSRDVELMIPDACGRLDALANVRACSESDMYEVLRSKGAWWHASSDEAQVVAAYLRCHPRVRELRYPGLRCDPSFEVAARTLQGGFGPYVDYRLGEGTPWHRIACTGADPRETVIALERALAGEDDGHE